MTQQRNSLNLVQSAKDNSSTTDSKGNLTKFPGQPGQHNDESAKGQLPQGDLIADLSQKLSCKEEEFKDLPVKEIKHFNIVKDFTLPTRSSCPIVIIFKDSGHCHCVDGWNLVQQAKEKPEDTIRCLISYMDSFDAAATGVFKTALRSMPPGGICTHAEMILNIRICIRLIKGCNEIPKASGHGGARKGSEFDNNFDQKIVGLLVEHLGKTKKKIQEYINHGADLPDDNLEFLVEKKASRRFFEEVQRNKAKVIADLKQKKVKPDAILTQISEQMKEWYEEYEKIGEITSVLKKTELPPEVIKQIPKEIIAPTKKAPKVHIRWTGNTAPQDLPPSKDQIYDKLGTIMEPFVQLRNDRPDIVEGHIQQVLAASKQLILLSESMEHQLEVDKTASEKEKVA